MNFAWLKFEFLIEVNLFTSENVWYLNFKYIYLICTQSICVWNWLILLYCIRGEHFNISIYSVITYISHCFFQQISEVSSLAAIPNYYAQPPIYVFQRVFFCTLHLEGTGSCKKFQNEKILTSCYSRNFSDVIHREIIRLK